jgi:hypothetical protein
MSHIYWTTRIFFLVLLIVVAPRSVSAADATSSAIQVSCVSGGIGESERKNMENNQERYSFWLTTAARKSGAYLSDIQVKIHDEKKNTVILECKMDGPWLFVDLPVGRYEIEAIYRKEPMQTNKKNTTIHKGDHHQMIMYFDVVDQI